MACQDLTPGLAPSQHPCMQPHFTPSSSPPTPLQLIAIPFLAINSLSGAYRRASPQCSLRTARPSTSTQPTTHPSAGSPLLVHHLSLSPPTHPFASFHKWPWLYPPSTPHFTRAAHLPHPLPKRVRLWGVHWHRTDWRLLGCTPRIIFKRSSLRSLRDMIIIYKERKKQFHEYFIHKNMTTTSGTHLQGLYSTQVRHHTHIDMLHVVSVWLNI